MDRRHYADFEPGVLEKQQTLCLHLRNENKFGTIEDGNSNPMTIRLLLAREGLKQVRNFVKKSQAQIQDPPQRYMSQPFSAKSFFEISASAASGCAFIDGYYEGQLPQSHSIHLEDVVENDAVWRVIPHTT